MKVLAINGSPREGGNTELLLKAVLKSIEDEGIDTTLLRIGASGIKPCMACGACFESKNRKCIMSGDNFNKIFEEMLSADAIILGSPTYFAGMTPELKSLIDRSGYVARANGGLFKHKIGAAVVAQRRGGATSVLESIYFMFLMSQMFVVGSTYWNMGFGGPQGEVLEDVEAMENMKDLGKNVAWLLKKVKHSAPV